MKGGGWGWGLGVLEFFRKIGVCLCSFGVCGFSILIFVLCGFEVICVSILSSNGVLVN